MGRNWIEPAVKALATQFRSSRTPTAPSLDRGVGSFMQDDPGFSSVQNRGYMLPEEKRPQGSYSPRMDQGSMWDFAKMREFQNPSPTTPAPGSNGGWANVSNAGGEWATLDGMNSYLEAAAQNTGIPPNLIKAMLAREGSFGKDKYVTDVGRRKADGTPDRIFAFNGIFESTAASYGIDFNRMTQDDSYAVWAMGRVLQGIKENNPNLGSWDNVAAYYFAGPNWNNPNWTDEVGNTVDSYKYHPVGGVITRMKYLDSLGGGSTNPGWSGNWDFIDQGQVHDWGEFNTPSNNGYYGYGAQYGLNGTNHTGVDITGPWNSVYRSPVSGTVTCAGTGNGAGADGGGCAAFNTMDGKGGAGRVEVQLDNGAVLIFGHSQGSFVRPGQRINAGDALGTVGWANSDHVHLEARIKDPTTSSGWRIVDPRTVLGGSWGGGPTQPAKPPRFGGNRWTDWG
jgi:murein DD-endopeptidase MepM/ murein hydrolase activator NlpD